MQAQDETAGSGNAIGVGDSGGDVAVDSGAVANSTALDVTVAGGTGISDASGGDDNTAFILEPVPVALPQVCITSLLGTACSFVFTCFDSGVQGTGCTIPDCTGAVPAPVECTGFNCEPGANAITACTVPNCAAAPGTPVPCT